jgi:hypothetical protein
MKQVREEQKLRADCLQGKEDRTPTPEVTDADVESKIKEVEEDLEHKK